MRWVEGYHNLRFERAHNHKGKISVVFRMFVNLEKLYIIKHLLRFKAISKIILDAEWCGISRMCRLVPVSVFSDVKERVWGRGLGGRMPQKMKTGKICHISERAKSNPTE